VSVRYAASRTHTSASSNKGVWGRIEEVKAEPKSDRYANFDKLGKRKDFDNKNYDSYNKAKMLLIANDFNQRRKTNDCMNCDETGHTFFEVDHTFS
jgi:hypothetical protein